MTYNRFLEIKEQYKDYEFKESSFKTELFNIYHNIKCYRNRLNPKDIENKEYYFKLLIDDFNYSGNAIFTQIDGIRNIICFIKNNVFTEDEWKQILPHIFFEDFNYDYDKLEQKLLPILGKLYKWRKDIYLEFWQGIFSFNTHWSVKNLTPKESINSPQNGELYCNTLLEIYPILADFMNKHPYAQYTLLNRLS